MEAISAQPPLSQPAVNAATLPLAYATAPAAQYPLYSPGAVGLATFVGAPVAGAAIMAMNYRRLGRPAAANKVILWGVAGTAALIALGFALGNHAPGIPLAFVPVAVMLQLARSLQGGAFSQHKAAGGKVASLWKAFGVGAASLVAVLAVIFAIAITADLASPSNKRLSVGTSEILYSGSATHADAQALADALTRDGYFRSGNAATVLLARNGNGTTLQFVVNEAAAQNDSTIAIFTALAQDVAPSIGGKPITMELVSPQMKVLKTTKIGG